MTEKLDVKFPVIRNAPVHFEPGVAFFDQWVKDIKVSAGQAVITLGNDVQLIYPVEHCQGSFDKPKAEKLKLVKKTDAEPEKKSTKKAAS